MAVQLMLPYRHFVLSDYRLVDAQSDAGGHLLPSGSPLAGGGAGLSFPIEELVRPGATNGQGTP